MASRQQVQRRKRALVIDLLASIDRGDLQPGDQIPSLANLVRTYELSRPTVLQTLQPLIDDGTLRTVRAVGTFVARAESSIPGCYVMVTTPMRDRQPGHAPTPAVAHGFEERVAWHGGTSVVLNTSEFFDEATRAALPEILGVFIFAVDKRDAILASVTPGTATACYLAGSDPTEFTAVSEDTELRSAVDLDNIGGGKLATEQLVRAGHHRIAFLGVHTEAQDHFQWSRQRARGWAEAMARCHPQEPALLLEPDPLPQDTPLIQPHRRRYYQQAAHQVARRAIERLDDFSACVAADDSVLSALAGLLTEQAIPVEQWPAMVGFEGLADAEPYLLTSVRPRWPELGATAADHLFDASRGKTDRVPPLARIPMTVISRPTRLHVPQPSM